MKTLLRKWLGVEQMQERARKIVEPYAEPIDEYNHSYIIDDTVLTLLITEVWNEAIKEERDRIIKVVNESRTTNESLGQGKCETQTRHQVITDIVALPRADITSDK